MSLRREKNNQTLSAWRRRRVELRAVLWDLLLAGRPPAGGRPNYRTLAQGSAALRMLWRTIDQSCKLIGPQFAHTVYTPFDWRGKITWDTSIITYRPFPGEPPQRAVLRVPRGLTQTAPAVLCFHGHVVGCLLGKEVLDYLAVPLAARGFVTLAIDAIRFGERRDKTYEDAETKDFHGMSFYSERNLAMPLMLEGKTLLGAMVWEHMRGVDMLRNMKFVDPKRIGAIGHSMGGMQTFWTTAMDPRIACGVEMRGICSFKQWAKLRTLNALVCFIPHILRHTDAGEIGGLIAPRPFMCLDAANDDFFPLQGIKEIHRPMRDMYSLYCKDDHFEARIDPGGHDIGQRDIDDAMDWLARWLKPSTRAAT